MVHAAGESGPVIPGTHAVVLGLTQDELHALEARLQAHGVPHAAIRDEDLAGRLVAIGLKPAPKADLRPHLSAYGLLREVPI